MKSPANFMLVAYFYQITITGIMVLKTVDRHFSL